MQLKVALFVCVSLSVLVIAQRRLPREDDPNPCVEPGTTFMCCDSISSGSGQGCAPVDPNGGDCTKTPACCTGGGLAFLSPGYNCKETVVPE